MKRYRFTSFWAALQITAGLLLLVASLALAVLLLSGTVSLGASLDAVPAARALAALGVVLVGTLMGGPAILAGQLLEIFLDQRRLLRLAHRRLRAIDDRERERDALERAGRRSPRRPDPLRDLGS